MFETIIISGNGHSDFIFSTSSISAHESLVSPYFTTIKTFKWKLLTWIFLKSLKKDICSTCIINAERKVRSDKSALTGYFLYCNTIWLLIVDLALCFPLINVWRSWQMSSGHKMILKVTCNKLPNNLQESSGFGSTFLIQILSERFSDHKNIKMISFFSAIWVWLGRIKNQVYVAHWKVFIVAMFGGKWKKGISFFR